MFSRMYLSQLTGQQVVLLQTKSNTGFQKGGATLVLKSRSPCPGLDNYMCPPADIINSSGNRVKSDHWGCQKCVSLASVYACVCVCVFRQAPLFASTASPGYDPIVANCPDSGGTVTIFLPLSRPASSCVPLMSQI
jgi:hypothetical protein